MKEVTVIELSEHTGLSRSKIYYLIKKGKIIISNGKINFEDAIRVITELTLKKKESTNEENFRHIFNMLYLQNITLQKQLDLAYEREKVYLAELTNYRQSSLQKTTFNIAKYEDNTLVVLDKNLAGADKSSLKHMQSEAQTNHAITNSCQSINKEEKSTTKTDSHNSITEPVQITITESENDNTEPKKGMTEQSDNRLPPPSLTPENTFSSHQQNSRKTPYNSVVKLRRRPPVQYPRPIKSNTQEVKPTKKQSATSLDDQNEIDQEPITPDLK